MAFNWQTFRTRTLTALIFVVVMLAGLLYNEWSFFLLIAVIHFGCWTEYQQLVEKIMQHRFHSFIKLGLMLLGFHILLLFCKNLSLLNYNVKDSFSLIFLIAGAGLIIIGIFKQTNIALKPLGMLALGVFYISLSLSLLTNIRLNYNDTLLRNSTWINHTTAYFLPLLIIAAIWINDTMAYVVGSAIGKTHFSKISPKKTIEGTVGGIILCVAAITLIFSKWFHVPTLLGISLIAGIMGTAGDLFESKLKRMAGIKDSGNFMPGHGGFLDRFDSLLFATPAVWLFLLLY